MTSPLNSIKKRVGSIIEQAPTLKNARCYSRNERKRNLKQFAL
jgi:hypothetical protein